MRQFIDVKTLDQTLSSYIITKITMRLESFKMKCHDKLNKLSFDFEFDSGN